MTCVHEWAVACTKCHAVHRIEVRPCGRLLMPDQPDEAHFWSRGDETFYCEGSHKQFKENR